MKALIVLNERVYNALRLAGSLARLDHVELKLFLIGDAATCAKTGQKVPSGYYNVQTMLRAAVEYGVCLGVCGSCMDARGIGDSDLVEGAHWSSMDELTAWTLEADKIIAL